jgi:hypothetical protein
MQQFLILPLQLFLLCICVAVGVHDHRSGARQEVDLMAMLAFGREADGCSEQGAVLLQEFVRDVIYNRLQCSHRRW